MAAFILKTCARLVVLVTAALLVSLAVKNRQTVSFYYNPFNITENGPALGVPLFVLLVGAVLFGVFVGMVGLGLDRLVRRHSARGLRARVPNPSSDLPQRDGMLKKTLNTKP